MAPWDCCSLKMVVLFMFMDRLVWWKGCCWILVVCTSTGSMPENFISPLLMPMRWGEWGMDCDIPMFSSTFCSFASSLSNS